MSAILSSDDLNDFISPGVACIKPVETLPKQDDSNTYEVTTEDKVQAANPAPASISLTDCLACSGCVTSAEAVLVSLQSHNEVLKTLDAHPELDVRHLLDVQNGVPNGHTLPNPEARVFVASVSPQVRASIAATYGVPERRAGYLIQQFLSGSQGLRIGGQHQSGFQYVVDTNRMREAALVLGAEEVADAMADKSKPRPILTSACPGWICYAEKTHPHILPYLSSLKSPQALSGTLLKSVLSMSLGIHPSQIWHLAIMPCFDKKLEASREELTNQWWQDQPASNSQPFVRDVDCVITSRELLSLAAARGIQLPSLPLRAVRSGPFPDARLSHFLFPRSRRQHSDATADAGTSGGYLFHILRTQQSLHPDSTLSVQRGRNADVVEYTLTPAGSDNPLFKAARYYGFRNIQNLVRKLKPPKQSKLPGAARRTPTASSGTEYSYVEVMACPGGCSNGGGQIKVEDVASILPGTRGEVVEKSELGTQKSQREWLKRVDETYFSADDMESASEEEEDADVVIMNGEHDEDVVNGINTKEVKDFLGYWAQLVDVSLDKLAYTTFRKVESDVGKKKNVSDTERIAAIAGMSGGGW
jgi:iron only hydrogenase large subunit-like protein